MDCKSCLYLKFCEVTGDAITDLPVDDDGEEIPNYDECKWYEDKTNYVKLPCKPGDSIFETDDDSIERYSVMCVELEGADRVVIKASSRTKYAEFFESEIGKNCYLDYKEAQKALEAKKLYDADAKRLSGLLEDE